MSDKSQSMAALVGLIKAKAGVNKPLLCTVDSVDVITKTCKCTPIGDYAEVFDVKIIADVARDGFIIYPKANTAVVVDFMDDGSPYVSMVSGVDEIHLAGVNYGGLAKTDDVKTRLNNLENKVNALITAFNAWVVVPNDGGAALKTALTSWVSSSLSLTTQGMISSTKVFHGDAT